MEDKGPIILRNQYHSCWWPGGIMASWHSPRCPDTFMFQQQKWSESFPFNDTDISKVLIYWGITKMGKIFKCNWLIEKLYTLFQILLKFSCAMLIKIQISTSQQINLKCHQHFILYVSWCHYNVNNKLTCRVKTKTTNWLSLGVVAFIYIYIYKKYRQTDRHTHIYINKLSHPCFR